MNYEVPPDLYKRIEAAAAKRGVTVDQIAQNAVNSFVTDMNVATRWLASRGTKSGHK